MSLRTRGLWIPAAAVFLAVLSATTAGEAGKPPAQLSDSLDPLNQDYPPSLKTALTKLGKAGAEFSARRFAEALAALPDDSVAAATAVADHVLVIKAEANLELERAEEAAGLFHLLAAQYPESPLVRQALLGEARARLVLSEPEAALAVLGEAIPGSDGEGLLLQAQAVEAARKRPEAVGLYLKIFTEYVGSEPAIFAEKRLRALSPSYLSRAENREPLLHRAENLIRAGRNLDARTLLVKLLEGHPEGLLAERICLQLADADTNLNRLSEALRYLKRVTDSSMAPQVTYLEAVCYRGLRNEGAFLARRDRARKLYPHAPETEKLLYSVATYYDVDNEEQSAHQAYHDLALDFPKGVYAERALWKIALYDFVGKRYREAFQGFRQCLLANPTAGAASAPAYWMGRCCDRLGDAGSATYFYRRTSELANNSYYGQRAREALAALKAPNAGSGPSLPLDDTRPLLDSIRMGSISIPQPTPAVVRILERARQLMAAGLPDLALSELESGCARYGNDAALRYSMSRIHASRENYFGAISALRRAFPDYSDRPAAEIPDRVWNILFPLQHFDAVSRQSAKNNLEPDLVLALIRQESAFQPAARSRADARGLMQLLPSTGRTLARQAGIPRYTVSKLYLPDTNITLGTRYLSSLVRRYGGRVELALAAYNAGYSRVDRWLQEFGDIDMAEFVERIPFSETRGYIKQVLSNKAHFHLRIEANRGIEPGQSKK